MNPVTSVRIAILAFACSIALYADARVDAQDLGGGLNGYAEPFRAIEVASEESGTIDAVLVREGQTVKAGQPLVQLNNAILNALLAIAEQNRQSLGRINAADAELKLREDRLQKLQALRATGDARQEEVDRAVTEVSVAEANLKTAHEEKTTRELEYEKIKAQIDRRTIYAPISGIVTKLHKDVGEFVAPNSPEVLTLVQLDKLLANFTLPSAQADRLQINDKLNVLFVGSQSAISCSVDFIAPTTDAESDTVLVRLLVDNSKNLFRSGQRCKLEVDIQSAQTHARSTN